MMEKADGEVEVYGKFAEAENSWFLWIIISQPRQPIIPFP
jgi:hypothetical protein